jgi:ribonucrease Y
MHPMLFFILLAGASGLFFWLGAFLRRKDAERPAPPAPPPLAPSSGEDGGILRFGEATALAAHDLALGERAMVLDERERALADRAAALDDREAGIRERETRLAGEEHAAEKRREEHAASLRALDAARARYEEALAETAGLTPGEARRELFRSMRGHFERDASAEADAVRRRALDRADEDARRVLSASMMRLAVTTVRDMTLLEMLLPNDALKGKIIGKDGANIRAFEAVTGVKLLVDDAPQKVFLSSFDGEAREAAQHALTRMIETGDFRPAAIEEFFREARDKAGEWALLAGREAFAEAVLDERAEAAPEMLRLMGGMRFQSAYGQNVLRHSVETARLAGIMADEMGMDAAAARRAGFFHDVGKAAGDMHGDHAKAGAETARRFGEPLDVVHAIEAHHGGVKPRTMLAAVVAAANAVSGARPGARHRSAADPIRRMAEAEQIAREFPGVLSAYAVHADHEVRVLVSERDVDDAALDHLAAGIARRLRAEVEYTGTFTVTVVRETRAAAVARP